MHDCMDIKVYDNVVYIILYRYYNYFYKITCRRCMHLGAIVKYKDALHIAFRDKV